MNIVVQELVHSEFQCPHSVSQEVLLNLFLTEKPKHSHHLHKAAHLSLAQHSLAAWHYLRSRRFTDLPGL